MAPKKKQQKQQKSIVYSFVARGTTILADYSALEGNFNAIALQRLETLTPENSKFTFPHEEHTLNYLIEQGYAYMCFSKASLSRTLSFAFLERVKEEFLKKYKDKAVTAAANSLSKEYGPKLKEHMQYVVDHPEEMDKLARIKAQVSEVKDVMKDNIDKVLQRGERMESLADKAAELEDQANTFQKKTKQIEKKFWLDNLRTKALLFGLLVVIALITYLSICRGFVCHYGI